MNRSQNEVSILPRCGRALNAPGLAGLPTIPTRVWVRHVGCNTPYPRSDMGHTCPLGLWVCWRLFAGSAPRGMSGLRLSLPFARSWAMASTRHRRSLCGAVGWPVGPPFERSWATAPSAGGRPAAPSSHGSARRLRTPRMGSPSTSPASPSSMERHAFWGTRSPSRKFRSPSRDSPPQPGEDEHQALAPLPCLLHTTPLPLPCLRSPNGAAPRLPGRRTRQRTRNRTHPVPRHLEPCLPPRRPTAPHW